MGFLPHIYVDIDCEDSINSAMSVNYSWAKAIANRNLSNLIDGLETPEFQSETAEFDAPVSHTSATAGTLTPESNL